jgi:hypothetical protein
MKTPNRVVTTPVAPSPAPTTLPFRRIFLVTASGGAFVAVVSAAFGQKYFGLGALVGALLAGGGLFSLKASLRRVLSSTPVQGKRLFLAVQAFRWVLWVLALYLLLKISPFCLLGAVASYIWFLGVLSVYGLQSAKGGVPPSASAQPE